VLGRLTRARIAKVLRNGTVGRIGVSNGGLTYVVPITYVYDGDSIYGHSRLGQKIRMLRKSPKICFEVDEIDDLANWRSVIAQGSYEELHGDLAIAAARLIRARLGPLTTSATAGPAGGSGRAHVSYRIRLGVMTGRYERTSVRARRRAR
jgi:nitroimidazol reductase NimA-like FMN-containing flavoprotein (pyridoxamine 5'-phosphate oxidase superfamily)